jgi:GH15 family glucan-1,4-alpha-glucosidase
MGGFVALRIEDYALIGDTHTCALVGRDGSIDWLCLPRFDSDAVFASLLGDERNGRWLLYPQDEVRRTSRRYREGTLILETDFETDTGAVRVIDFMPHRRRHAGVVRIVQGLRGRVPMRMELVMRFEYGSRIPWVHRIDGGLRAVAGPDALELRTQVEPTGRDMTTVSEFSVAEGEQVPFTLTWYPSNEEPPHSHEARRLLEVTEHDWVEWSSCCPQEGPYAEAITRSLITLKALTYEPTGGIVAAATTSLPEKIGGARNWDYRYCWMRDATFTLYALMVSGHEDEASAWRDWLARAVAGTPADMQIMYGVAGERRLTELELPWLSGYERSAPVRIGNAAVEQFQLDVYGELMDSIHLARRSGLQTSEESWQVQRELMDFLESKWREPDEGIWEMRGGRRHFTHSKVMAWVAFDRAVKSVERFGLDGPLDRWRGLRQEVHDEVCEKGYDADRGAFTQYYGSDGLDASLLMIPLVGFLPATDERMRSTVEAIERELVVEGFVHRYATESSVDGLPPGEGAFLACTFWLADNMALMGRLDEARSLLDTLLGLANDVGLLSEQYDVRNKRLVGNFPQAFSHVGLINTVRNITLTTGPAEHRGAASA